MILQGPWRVEHVDLNQPIASISARPGDGGVFIVLWCDDVPVGIASFLSVELPILSEAFSAMIPSIIASAIGSWLFPETFPAKLRLHRSLLQPARTGSLCELLSETAVVNRFARRFEAVQSSSHSDTLSVVICTRERPLVLKRCLDSLAPIVQDLLEIIVVDNAPHSAETEAVTRGRERVRYVVEPRSGLSIARNTGMRQAKGSIIAFTDDDAIVHPTWARRLSGAFTSPDTLCVTGLVLPLELRTPSQLAFEIELEGLGRGLQSLRYRDQTFRPMIPFGPPVWNIGAGANMAIRRSALALVGGFDERLGAGASGCSEDSEFWYRVLAAGYDCRYDPSIVVFHQHRETDAQLVGQMRAYMKGHVSALLVQYARHGHSGNLRRLFGTLPFYYILQILAALRPSYWDRWRLLAPQLTGYIAGFEALRWFRQIDRASRPWKSKEGP